MTSRSPRTRVAILAAAAGLLASCSDGTLPTSLADEQGPAFSVQAAGADYIVAASNGRFDAVAAAIVDAGGTVVRSHPEVGILIAAGLSDGAAEALAGVNGVQIVMGDVMIAHEDADLATEAGSASHDPSAASFYQLGYQWDMQIIHADDAWAAGASGDGVTVAIIDSGIDATHPDLAGLVDASRSVAFVPNANPLIPAWGDDYFHGTHVAGTVVSNGLGTSGVAPHTTLMAVKVCGAFFGCPFGAILSGIVFSATNGADVVNMSLGGLINRSATGGGSLNALLNRVINYAASQGVTVVSAAGNSGLDLDHLGRDYHAGPYQATPCANGNGMCVSATNVFDEVTSYSNYGTSAVGVAAPGGDGSFPVLSVCSTQSVYLPTLGINCGPTNYLWATGTSMAAPHVSGAAALLAGQGMNPGQILSTLQNSADDLGKPGTDAFYGKGRLNVLAAIGG
jgi:subtilisin family serine protease